MSDTQRRLPSGKIVDFDDIYCFLQDIDPIMDVGLVWSSGGSTTTIAIGKGTSFYQQGGKWGFATASEKGPLRRVTEPIYDEICALGRRRFAARDGANWYYIDDPKEPPASTFSDPAALIRHIHRGSSSDALQYENSKLAVRPDEILWKVPHSRWIVFRYGNQCCIGENANKYTPPEKIVPYLVFDSEEIAITEARGAGTAFIGKIGEAWSIYSTNEGHCGDFDTLDQAIDSWRASLAKEQQHDGKTTIRVDAFGRNLGDDNLTVFRVGNRWGIGQPAYAIYRLPSRINEDYVVPYAGWFDSDDIDMRHDWEARRDCFVGKVRSTWIAFDELGRCYGRYETADDAWKSFARLVDQTQEPHPVGVGCADPPECYDTRGPSFIDLEILYALRESGEELVEDPDADLRQDEARLHVPDIEKQLASEFESIAPVTVESGNIATASSCPNELQRFVNLTPGAEYGCCVPIAWFVEFLGLQEGESCNKSGYAWFYKQPHDREECLYQASVADGVLSIDVEVGPEALTRTVRFELFSATPNVVGKGAE